MATVALVINEKEKSFSLITKSWNFSKFAEFFDRITRSERMLFCWNSNGSGMVCMIKCYSRTDFLRMQKELKRELY